MKSKSGFRNIALILMGCSLIALMLCLPALAQKGAVHFKQLVPFVEVKIPGYEIEDKPSGSTLKHNGHQMSEAKAAYRSGDKRLEIQVMDFWGQTIPFLSGMPQVEMESSTERLKTTQVQGFKALETFRPQDKEGELSIGVADRFWVKIDGDGIDNPEILHTAAKTLDLKKLAELAK
jgi:hypothetical protein